MSFFTGLAGGIAEGASRTIGTILDKREEEASAARKYMQQRNIQKSEKYEAEKAEMESLVNAYADLTGGDIRKASQLIKGAGNIDRANSRLEMLNLERQKNENFDINKLYTFAETETNSDNPYTVGEFVENLVGMPTFAKMPESKKFGLGLADKFLPKAEQIALPTRTGREFDIGTATMIPGTTTAAQEYQLKQDAAQASLDLTQAKIKEIEGKGDTENALSFSSYKTSFDNELRQELLPLDIPVDGEGNFSLKTAQQKGKDFKDAWTNSIGKFARQGVAAKGTLSTDGNLQQLINRASLKMNDEYIVDVNQYTPETAPSVGSAYFLKDEKSGINMPHLYLGSSYGFVALQ